MESFALKSYLRSLSAHMCVSLGFHLEIKKYKIKDLKVVWNYTNHKIKGCIWNLLTQSLLKLFQYIIFINRPFFPNRQHTAQMLFATIISFTMMAKKLPTEMEEKHVNRNLSQQISMYFICFIQTYFKSPYTNRLSVFSIRKKGFCK